MAKKDRWRYTAGQRGHRVTAEERPSGMVWCRVYDPELGRSRPWSLKLRLTGDKKHDTAIKKEAEKIADTESQRLKHGAERIIVGRPSWGTVFANYLSKHSPLKRSEQERKSDRRRAAMFTKQFGGAEGNPETLEPWRWKRFQHDRRNGIINQRGDVAPEGKRKKVGRRTVEADCMWLVGVLNWAKVNGYISQNPIDRSLDQWSVPRELSPQQPIATTGRYEALRPHVDGVTMQTTWHGKRRRRQSWLGWLLDLHYHHGHRITQTCNLRERDIILKHDIYPHGAIVWTRMVDKEEIQVEVPMNVELRASIDRLLLEHALIDEQLRDRQTDYLFPRPTDLERPINRYTATYWLRKAEKAAGLPPQQHGAFHPYRRGFVVEKKDCADVDVARFGGWANADTMRTVYQKPDPDSQLAVANSRRPIRREGGDS